ncbi:MAG: hypothetical protein Q7R80_00155 [bacterium]|nr:hypothetical protein [bacterium]
MFGVLLAAIGTFFEEVSTSLGKWEMTRKTESPFTYGFLQLFWGTVILLGIALVRPASFVFSTASLPTLLSRVIIEIIQAHVTVVAISIASRSTFGFIRVLTVPLLLGVDIMLGLVPTPFQAAGIALTVITLVLLFRSHGIERTGAWLTLFTAVNAVSTLSLYQYNVRHFNSVVAEQLIMHVVLVAYFAIVAVISTHEHPFRLLLRRATLLQSGTMGIGSVIDSFAVLFAPISIVLAAKRSSSVLWAVFAGRLTFHEGRLALKIAAVVLLASGLVLLAV